MKWIPVKKDKSNLVEGKTYNTALYVFGEYQQQQEMMYQRGLWWIDGTYVYYQPTHIQEM